jgi:predicted AlkP superfamily pyrophosphatase or phosphodiesterase
MRRIGAFLAGAAGVLALAGCAELRTPPPLTPAADAPAPALPNVAEQRPPVTILVSIDGFRADYLSRGATPVLARLARSGATGVMRPSFPSITFPNHWTLVTGLRPDHAGVVGNTMHDPRRPGETFTMSTDDPFWWNAAEPIWVTAEKANIRTATMFWPGANVAWGATVKGAHGTWQGGVRPQDWQQFNQAVTGEQRVNAVLDWMRRPAAIRPRLVTLYFDAVDTAGHSFGPDDRRTMEAAAGVDAQIGQLVDGLAALHQPANLVIVADHGMAQLSNSRVIELDRIANPADYNVTETGAYATLDPVPGHEAALANALAAPHPHLQCWPKAQVPARFAYGTNPRVPAWLCLAEVGWFVRKTAGTSDLRGTHGYDNMAPDMAALFIANGPAFVPGTRLAPFDNVAVAPLMRDLLGLPAGERLDGNDQPFAKALRR